MVATSDETALNFQMTFSVHRDAEQCLKDNGSATIELWLTHPNVDYNTDNLTYEITLYSRFYPEFVFIEQADSSPEEFQSDIAFEKIVYGADTLEVMKTYMYTSSDSLGWG